MKVEKNKIVFSAILFCILLFIASYAMLVLGEEEELIIENNQIPIPELEDNQKGYDSKLDALNDLKEVRQTNAPSIYDERLLNTEGIYDPNHLEKEKARIIDSIYHDLRFINSIEDSSDTNYADNPKESPQIPSKEPKSITPIEEAPEPEIQTKTLALNQQLFFASNPIEDQNNHIQDTDKHIHVRVDGTQTVKTHYRLQMRLTQDAMINGKQIPKNTKLYGFISFEPNRTMIAIKNINHKPISLKAYDYQDGSEGIYIENSFKADVSKHILNDVIQDVNIAGVPQVSGVKRIFQKQNRTVKVTIADNYKLILKKQ